MWKILHYKKGQGVASLHNELACCSKAENCRGPGVPHVPDPPCAPSCGMRVCISIRCQFDDDDDDDEVMVVVMMMMKTTRVVRYAGK